MKMKVKKLAKNSLEACEFCFKTLEESVVSISAGTKYDQTDTVMFAHPTCLKKAVDKAVSA